jgi:hypothetical protein
MLFPPLNMVGSVHECRQRILADVPGMEEKL